MLFRSDPHSPAHETEPTNTADARHPERSSELERSEMSPHIAQLSGAPPRPSYSHSRALDSRTSITAPQWPPRGAKAVPGPGPQRFMIAPSRPPARWLSDGHGAIFNRAFLFRRAGPRGTSGSSKSHDFSHFSCASLACCCCCCTHPSAITLSQSACRSEGVKTVP